MEARNHFKVMLLYPPGRLYQRSEDRAQSNIQNSAASSVHACNDLGYAAAILRLAGYPVFLRDYQTEQASFVDVIADVQAFQPDLILLSVTNATIFDDVDFVNALTKKHKAKVVLKGAIFYDLDLSKLSCLDLKNVSVLIGGEMDTIIRDVADWLLLGLGDPEKIPGICYRSSAQFRKTAFHCWAEDLDEIPFPARDLMNNGLYTRPDTGEAMATIQIARGCPAGCIYCLTPIISGRKVRCRSVENVFAEIEECYYKYGIRNFFFKADTFTINQEWAMALCDRIIASDLWGKIAFTANSRTNSMTESLLQKMKEAGCFMLAVGFESGCDETMKRIKKGADVQDSLRAVDMIRRVGIPLFGFFMIGFPWETKADLQKTLSFIFKVDPDFIELHIAMPYFGTELYSACESYNTIKNTSWGSDYFFTNTIGTASVPMDEILEMKRKTLMRFYTRPKYVFRRLRDCVTNPIVLKNYMQYGIRLIKNNLKRS